MAKLDSAELWVRLVSSNMLICRVYLVGYSQIFIFFGNQCSHVEVPVVSYFPLLMVLKSGKGFLFPQELAEFGQTMIKCSTESSHNMDFIHQSVASDTPNDKQKSEAGCSYEKLRTHILEG